MKITDINKILHRSEYTRNVIQLITGTSLAQGINFLFNIYLTRIYAPEDFGKFFLFMNILSVIFIFSTFKLDIEIVKSANADEINNNVKLAYQINLLVSFVSVVLLLILWKWNFFNLHQFSLFWILSAFFIVYLQTSVQILWMYCVKQKLFSFQSKYKIFEALSLNIMYVLFQSLRSFGLLIANIFNLIITNFILVIGIKKHFNFWSNVRELVTVRGIKEVIRIFKRQKFYMFQSILEVLQVSLIPFYFSLDLKLIGYYSLTMRVLQVPMRFLSMPISQVFFSEMSDRKVKQNNMSGLFRKTLWMMCIISVPMVLVIVFFGPDLFGIVFGSNWTYSGKLSQIFILWIIFDFIKAPMIHILYLFNKQKFVFYTLLWSVLLMWALLESRQYFNISIHSIFWGISISQSLFILILIYQSYLIIKKHEGRNEV